MNATTTGKISLSLKVGIAFIIMSATLFALSTWSEQVRVVGLLGGVGFFCVGIAFLGYYSVRRYGKKQRSFM